VTGGKQPGRGCIAVMEGVAANICRRIKVFSSVTTKRVHLAERTLQANDVVRRYGDGRTTETIASGEPDKLTRTSVLPATFRSARPAAARDDTALVQKKTNVVSIGCGLSRICSTADEMERTRNMGQRT